MRYPFGFQNLGNHEFDLGVEGLASFIDHLQFPVISANTDISGEPRLQGKVNKSCIITKGSENIGIIGYAAEDTSEISTIGKPVYCLR